jgi:hypothetical protein
VQIFRSFAQNSQFALVVGPRIPHKIQVADQMAGIVLFICNGGTAHARTDNFSPVLYLSQPCGA